jgi:hypothetical protein
LGECEDAEKKRAKGKRTETLTTRHAPHNRGNTANTSCDRVSQLSHARTAKQERIRESKRE